jgi:uncharacterized membrane protein
MQKLSPMISHAMMRKPVWLRANFVFAMMLIVSIGVAFRFANLGAKVYWGDEVYTSMRILGYSTTEIQKTIASGNVVPAAALQQFQSTTPQNGVAASVQSLIKEDSHLTPLYFVLARLWVNLFGTSPAAIRSVSALFSVITLPVTYWLAMELFGSGRIAWMTVMLAAISPVQLVFAQEARFYSLWILTTTLSSACLLRAMRVKTISSWAQFTGALVLNLYTQFLAVFTLAGYIAYVLLTTWNKDWKTFRRFSLATILGSLSLLPWVWIYLTRTPETMFDDNVDHRPNLIKALRNWFVLLSRAFIDFDLGSTSPKLELILFGICTCICLGITAAAARKMFQETPKHTWLFVLTLTIGPLLPLIQRTLNGTVPPRYVLPIYLSLQLVLGYLLGRHFSQSTGSRSRRLWAGATVFLVMLGLLSSASMSRAETWWIKQYSSCNIAVAHVVNNSPKPLIITDGNGIRTFDHALSNAISLSHRVKPETQFQLFLENQLPATVPVADGFSDRYLFSPSTTLLARIEQQYPKLEAIVDGAEEGYRSGNQSCLWRLPSR